MFIDSLGKHTLKNKTQLPPAVQYVFLVFDVCATEHFNKPTKSDSPHLNMPIFDYVIEFLITSPQRKAAWSESID